MSSHWSARRRSAESAVLCRLEQARKEKEDAFINMASKRRLTADEQLQASARLYQAAQDSAAKLQEKRAELYEAEVAATRGKKKMSIQDKEAAGARLFSTNTTAQPAVTPRKDCASPSPAKDALDVEGPHVPLSWTKMESQN